MKISVLGSGSKGNSSAILIEKRAIMIDAGFFYRDLIIRMKERDLFPESIIAILITHEHNDHIKGLGTFVKRHKIPVYISTCSYDNLSRTLISDLGNNVVLFNAGQSLKIGQFEVQTFSVSHDSADAVGFAIQNNKKKAGYITDLGESRVVLKIKDVNTTLDEVFNASVEGLELQFELVEDTNANVSTIRTTTDSIQTDTTSIIATLGTLIADIWNYAFGRYINGEII